MVTKLGGDTGRTCPICGDPILSLPRSDSRSLENPRFRDSRRTCTKPQCVIAQRLRSSKVFVASGQRQCLGPGCGKPIPTGWYSKRQQRFFCSTVCERRFYRRCHPNATCAYCGAGIRVVRHRDPSRTDFSKIHFCGPEHKVLYGRQKKALLTGNRWAGLLEQYLDEVGLFRPKSTIEHFRWALNLWLTYLESQGTRDFARVRRTRWCASSTGAGSADTLPSRSLAYLNRLAPFGSGWKFGARSMGTIP
jgi:hypothetical protein